MKNNELSTYSKDLLIGISSLINEAKSKVAIYVNVETTVLYWSIGDFITTELKQKQLIEYGKQILATVSQELTELHGKGYSYSALTRMIKIAETFPKEKIATLSQHLSWSHFIEFTSLKDETKREFYVQMSIAQNWGVRDLRKQVKDMLFERTAISEHPEYVIKKSLNDLSTKNQLHPDLVFKNTYILDFMNLPQDFSERELESELILQIEKFIMELGVGFAFLERQKRIPIDSTDYYLDLLFFHRKLNRLIAIDLKLGKFEPKYKSQMELYLRWLQKYEMEKGEEKPIGLLLCSEGNTEHIELLLLDEKDIKVAQFVTELPSKEWFASKLHRAIEIAKEHNKLEK
jgi:predicted nuclease of restriction endonuclease-like (RecB) superfamily